MAFLIRYLMENNLNEISVPVFQSLIEKTELILVVDDSESYRMILVHYLKQAGYRVIEARSGMEAIEQAQEMPDLILLDVNLPDLNGYEVCSILKAAAKTSGIPILQNSASFTTGHDHHRGIESGADAFFCTPIDPLILLSTVKPWLRVRRAELERNRMDFEREEMQVEAKNSDLLREHAHEQLYQFFMQAPQPMVILLGPEHKFFIANEPYERLMGRKVIGKRVMDVFTHEELKEYMPFLDAVYKTGIPFIGKELLLRIPNASGVLQNNYIDVSYHPFREDNGTIKGVLARIQDVTHAVQARREIEETEGRFRMADQKFGAIFFSSAAPMVLFRGPELVYEIVNSRYQELFPNRELVGKPLIEALPEVADSPFPNMVKTVFKTGVVESVLGVLIPVHNVHTGVPEERYFDTTYVRIDDGKGNPYGVFAYAAEVTVRVKVTNELEINRRELKDMVLNLEHSEAKFRSIADAMPQMVWSTLPDGFHDYYNKQWYEFTGVPIGSTDGEAWNGMFHPEDQGRAWGVWRHCLKTGDPYEIEYRLRHHTGKYHWTLGRALPVRDENGEITRWMGTCTDIQEMRTAVDQLAQSVSDLSHERELREKFVATLSHDMRSPLTAAKMSAQLILRKSQGQEILETLSGKIVQNINRTDQMIQDLLDANRIRAGEPLHLNLNKCDFSQIIEESVFELTTVHGDRLKFLGPSEVSGTWDRGAIRRMVENLVNNAFKYGGPTTPVKVHITTTTSEVILKVQNMGHPISEYDQNSLFDPHQRTDSAKKGNQKGWGLGLTLVKGVAEAHRGEVHVESSKEGGTVFTVTLPIK